MEFLHAIVNKMVYTKYILKYEFWKFCVWENLKISLKVGVQETLGGFSDLLDVLVQP
jgi:hypothetical protein